MKILIATIKQWNIDAANRLKKEYAGTHEITVFSSKEELTYDAVAAIGPDIIFFPHWSFFIPECIFENFECVVFHMTDLPYGRGGSPLQNLIVRGVRETKISALRVVKELDAGPIYMKEPLTLEGAAWEIFERASRIIFERMIPKFLEGPIKPKPQEGEVVEFKRRKPEDGELSGNMSLETMYDYIRMLDGEGYPPAFVNLGDKKLEFSEARLENGKLTATVRFVRRED